MADRLRSLWDFDDLAATEERLQEQLVRETTDDGQAEVLTQLARVEGLRGDFAAGERLIEEAESLAGSSDLIAARIDLERGRLRRSGGGLEAALRLFESAFALALKCGQSFIAADAAHMAALAAPDRDEFIRWTTRGIELAESSDDARYWLGPLLNNLGWEHYDTGDYEQALDAFERALRAREQDPGNREAIELAHFAVGKALRALGRSEEAVPLLEEAVAWAAGAGRPDGWFHEELAEEYAAVGREGEAREQAQLALALLERADPSLSEDAERSARLHQLGGEH